MRYFFFHRLGGRLYIKKTGLLLFLLSSNGRKKIFICIFVLLFSSGASAVANFNRPTFSLKRVPNTNTVSVKFSGVADINMWAHFFMAEIGIYIHYKNGNGYSLMGSESLVRYHPQLSCENNGCQVGVNAILGKTYERTGSKSIDDSCIVIGDDDDAGGVFNVWSPPTSNSCTYVPPGDCVGDDCDTGEGETPPPALACSVKTSSINLAFGSFSMGESATQRASSNVTVNCNRAGAKLTMKLKSGGSDISLDNGMSAHITAQGRGLGETISAVKGNNIIAILGTLKGSEKEGAFSGSGVLVTDYQ